MAQQHASPSTSTSTPMSAAKAGSGSGSGSKLRTKKSRSSLAAEANVTPSRVTAAAAVPPSSFQSKGKGRAVDHHDALAPLPPLETGKKERKRRSRKDKDRLNGESSTSGAAALGTIQQLAKRRSDLWDAIPVAQSEVSRIPPVWSKDGRFYFTVTHTSIHVHSSTAPSFSRLSTLSSTHPNGHTKPITSLNLSPLNPFQIISSSDDGSIKVWDWVAGRLVRTVEFKDLGAKVEHLAFGEVLGKWWMFAAVTHQKDGSGSKFSHRVMRVPLSGTSAQSVIGKLSAPPTALMMSPRGTYLVALAATKAYTYRMPVASSQPPSSDPWEARPTCVKFVSDQSFTCGAFCPEKTLATTSEEEWFATGDQKGVIRLWHGLTQAFRQVDAAAQAMLGGAGDSNKVLSPETENRLPTTSLHWHAHAVSAIAFTPSGSQLLSVGEESVLVQWHLASGKREYIPRLGGRPIISLAIRKALKGAEEEWWMSLADGAVIRVGAASNQVSSVGQGVRLDPLRPTSATKAYPIALHPSTQSLVVPSSHPSTLQFIDPVASTVLFDLEVAPSNRVSRRDEKELEPVAVEKVAFSDTQDGKSVWMATMEGRKGDDMEGGGMIKNLKLWKWADDKYTVNTQFPRPHGIADVTSVVFSPIAQRVNESSSTSSILPTPYLFTASADGVAKIWQVRQSKKNLHGELYWSCRSTFDYRGMPILDAAFSSDATIVAITHGSVITLWDVESNILLKVLDTTSGTVISKIRFIGSEGRYLVGSGEEQGLVVWDLLSCEAAWAITSQPVRDLITSPSASFFITSEVSSKSSKVTIFSPSSPKPLRNMSTSRPVSRLTLLPNPSGAESSSSLHLIGVAATSGEIFRFGDTAASAAPLGAKSISTSIGSAAPDGGLSIWQEMFGKDAFLDDLSSSATLDENNTATASALQQRVAAGKGRPSDIFSGPSHTMPPTTLLFDAFMDELLSGHTASTGAGDDGADVEGDGQDEGVLYEEESKVDVVPLAVNAPAGRAVDDHEVKSLEAFFKDVLSVSKQASTTHRTPAKPIGATPTAASASGVKTKVNGHLPNGDHPSVSVSTPLNKRLGIHTNGHGHGIPQSGGKSSSTKSKSKDVGAGDEGDHAEDISDQIIVLDTPDGDGEASAKQKGKKRKAPRED
ncbi:NET1-associated nuclear protein 1 (U3 small nucleolar RNA-associated protein 17) [Kwoniella heveanensis CBS 569]|nr:NET1-associated nuclear protein 1 (U3 small nucleolar RNA-associated protein 17) [Kwoniella heveanensis CBS 569]